MSEMIHINKVVESVSITHKFDLPILKFLNTSDVENGKIVNINLLPLAELKGQAKKTIKKHDILFSEIRPKNKRFAYVDVDDTYDYVVSTKLMVLRNINPDVDNKYFYYFLTNDNMLSILQDRAENRIGSFPQITFELLSEYSIRVPKLSEQQQIASVLSALDSKIELNNRINAELEAMAKTLYDYWFVQFDFPDENGKPYKTSGGKMVWNEELKREIPEGWEVKTLDNYAEVKKGDLITAKDAEQGSIKVIAAGVDFSYLHSTPNRLKNTITISGSGANAGFINFWREPIFASDCITVRGKSDIETITILQYLNFIQPHILNQATGSAQPHVYPSDIKVLNYSVPPKQLSGNYGKVVLPMNEKIGNNILENQKLTELRDWLLPMLMNGQVKVN
jgi:type I restriction enzyme S subunit